MVKISRQHHPKSRVTAAPAATILVTQICISWLLAIILTILGSQGLSALGADDPGPARVQVILSSQDGSNALTSASPLRLGPRQNTQAPIITLDLSRKGQSILGFGGSLDHATCENLSKLTPERRDEVMTRLMDPEAGIGMNLMRVCIGTSDFVGEAYYTYTPSVTLLKAH